MIRHYASAGAVCVALALGLPAQADYRSGLAAFDRGDFATAQQEFRDSARAGDRDALYMLGHMYEKGRGVNQSFVRAHAFYNLAAGLGRQEAAQARDEIAQRMTAQQIAEAQRRADGWRRDLREEERGRRQAAAATSSTSGASAATSVSTSASATVAPGISPVFSVRNLQEGLNRLGYNAGPVDGLMGAKTRTAIREFEAAQGLPVTGQPTAALYDQVLAALSGGTRTTTARVEPDRTPSTQLITDVQSELRQAGYEIDTVSGRMDEQTRQAIIEYQGDAGLTITGQANEQLLASLRSATGRRDLESRRTLVRSIQQELNDRGYDAGPADGTFGPKTRSAIRTYQSDASLQVTGRPTPQLLASLRSGATTGATAAVGTDAGLVRDVQQALNDRGYDAGPADGTLGAQTRQAIREFQKNMNMAVTGEPSVGLLASLQKSEAGEGTLSKSQVIDLKNALAARGYRVGPIEGTLDDQTRAAIRAYQSDAGISVDGRADAQLLSHVRTSDVRAGPTTPGQAAGQLMQDMMNRMTDRPR